MRIRKLDKAMRAKAKDRTYLVDLRPFTGTNLLDPLEALSVEIERKEHRGIVYDLPSPLKQIDPGTLSLTPSSPELADSRAKGDRSDHCPVKKDSMRKEIQPPRPELPRNLVLQPQRGCCREQKRIWKTLDRDIK